MPVRRFVVANVLSALVWAPVHVFPAQLAGLSVGRLQAGDGQTVAMIAAALALMAALATPCTGWGGESSQRGRSAREPRSQDRVYPLPTMQSRIAARSLIGYETG